MNNTIQTMKKRTESIPELSVIIALLVIMTVTQIVNPNFMTAGNMTAMLKSIPFIALVTIGTSFCLISKNVDISCGRAAGLAGMVFGYILQETGSLGLALAGGIGTGLAMGVINGVLSVHLGINSFIVTMGTMYVAGGLRYIINNAKAMTLPEYYRNFSQATPLGVSWFFWMTIVIYIIVGFVQWKTVFGRQLYAVGNNEEVARLQGVHTKTVQMAAFVIAGLFSGLAGVMATIDINSAQPATGTGWEFKAIAACMVGGISISGGTGRAFGAALGIVVVFIINNIINMLGISNYYSDVFTGCVLAGAVLVDILRKSRKIKA